MSVGVLFWVVLIIWAIFGGYVGFRDPANRAGLGSSLVLLILLGLLGYAAFGSPIRG